MRTSIFVCAILIGILSQSLLGSADQALLNKKRSFAPSLDGTAPIHQIIGDFERAMQQNDLEQLLSLFVSDTDINEIDQLPSDAVAQFSERFHDSRNLTLTTECNMPGWLLTGYARFSLLVDSITIVDNHATAYLRATWANSPDKGDLAQSFILGLTRDGQCWRFNSAAQVLGVIDAYADGEVEFNDPNVKLSKATITSVSRSTTGYYDAVDSDALMNATLFWESPQVGRMNRQVSRNQIQTGAILFGCATQISSFIYVDAEDFATDQIAVSDECWRRIVALDDYQQYLVAKGRRGSGANLEEFSAPQGLEYCGPSLLYIAEDYNNRIKLVSLNPLANDKMEFLRVIQLNEFNRPMDLDVTLPDQYGQRSLVVANKGGNNVIAFDDREPGGAWHIKVHSAVEGVGFLVRPTSIAFDRHPQTSMKTFGAYLIDSDNKRIVKINNVNVVPSQGAQYSDFPDPHTHLSSIAVDNKGEVYVADKGLGKIYKFNSSLQLIAVHGFQGTGDREYLHPTSISFTQGRDANGNMLSGLGEVALAEKWTDETGIRRLVPGTELFSSTITFVPKLVGGTPARVKGTYFITGYSNVTEELISPSGAVLETRNQLMKASGLRSYDFSLNSAWPSGQYTMKITAASIYTNSNSDQVSLSVAVDQSITNQRPVANNIWFPDGDSCFIQGEYTKVSAGGYDPDGTISQFKWSVNPPDAGELAVDSGQTVWFVTNEEPTKDLGVFLSVRARDNYGEYSSTAHQISVTPLIHWYDSECLCTWQVGDANFSHNITVSDPVYIINHLFGGGPLPKPVLMAGDANCSGGLSISDAVFLNSFLFGGGPPPQCTCSDF